ncbi:uncharacterized protein LOC111164338 isoform X3 [Delphinapterus leucas]|uniref:Uncharacterized protein LOC111164338 isoform X3 n=1 Tax=Delphinapterus leucas TaxID=9749 RepID=A0A2Y9LLN0_DELLE|nr:uncharacterized protein LOC111164338 isoform X3 [Delphinapterus leucas]
MATKRRLSGGGGATFGGGVTLPSPLSHSLAYLRRNQKGNRTCLAKPWLEESLDTDQGQRVLRSGVQSTPRRRLALKSSRPFRREARTPGKGTKSCSAHRSSQRQKKSAALSRRNFTESSWPERGLGDAGCSYDAHTRLGATARLPAPRAPIARRLRPRSLRRTGVAPEDAGPRAPARPSPPCRAGPPATPAVGADLIGLRGAGQYIVFCVFGHNFVQPSPEHFIVQNWQTLYPLNNYFFRIIFEIAFLKN